MEAIALKSGTQIVHVPYPSSPAAVTALLRNDVQMVCLPGISVTPQAAAGKLKILAVSTAQRSALMPGIPTLEESGIDVEADAWNGLIAPARTPPAIIAAVRAAVIEALAAPDIRAKLAAQIMEPIPGTPEEFRVRIDDDIARWTSVIKAANIKVRLRRAASGLRLGALEPARRRLEAVDVERERRRAGADVGKRVLLDEARPRDPQRLARIPRGPARALDDLRILFERKTEILTAADHVVTQIPHLQRRISVSRPQSPTVIADARDAIPFSGDLFLGAPVVAQPREAVAREARFDHGRLVAQVMGVVARDLERDLLGLDQVATVPAMRRELAGRREIAAARHRALDMHECLEPRQSARPAPRRASRAGAARPVDHVLAVERHVAVDPVDHAAKPRAFGDLVRHGVDRDHVEQLGAFALQDDDDRRVFRGQQVNARERCVIGAMRLLDCSLALPRHSGITAR